MKKRVGRILVGIIIILIIFVGYIFWDNNRFIVVKQDIKIDHLPKQLEDFTILQITDLHEKEFGNNQMKLIEKINAIDYDAIVFTGDMLETPESMNVEPFYTLLDGINHKEHALFVLGNDDPPSYEVEPSLEKSAFIKGIEKRGVTFLEMMDTITVDGVNVRFVNFEMAIVDDPDHIGSVPGIVQPDYMVNEKYLSHQKELWMDMDTLSDSDIVIALNHFPVVDERIDYIVDDKNTVWRDFDLIIAGHYHGGQFRLPFIGALFVPEAWYDSNGLFPPQDRVKGLWEYQHTKQYASAGLGSSGAIPFLKFRLFNSPEINVLSLKKARK